MTTPKPRHLRIFISSPGDVADERGIAERVIKDLNFDSEFKGKFTLEPIRWDSEEVTLPMPANETAQKSVDRYLIKPSQCDLVVVIFWAKIGTPVTIDERDYLSGTHYEYSEALEASASNDGVPQVWVYRCEKTPKIEMTDPDFDKKRQQWLAVGAFFDSFNDAEGRIIRNYNAYEQPSEFGEKLEEQLKTHLHHLLRYISDETANPIVSKRVDSELVTLWKGGKESPFPGLTAFTEDEAPIFFGRGRETDKLVQMVGQSRFVAVVGASGSGKSSLVAAGLIPRLRGNTLEGSSDWDVVHCVPGEKPFMNLAQALLNDIPILAGDPIEYAERSGKLAETLAQAPDNLHKTLNHVLKDEADWKEVLIFVDQFEELLTLTPENQREAFAAMLTYSSPKVRVVVTMRADFYHRMLKYLEEPLRDGNFTLYKPSAIALHEMISRPASLAGLHFEDGLPEQIIADTGDEPGALALMAYALDELYKLDDDKRLTHDEYEQLGGVRKAIGTRAEYIFKTLLGDKTSNEETLFHVFHELIEVDEKGTATRRRIQFNSEQKSDPVHELVSAFADARLLTMNQSAEGATLEIAHEALLREWDKLSTWIEQRKGDLYLLGQMRRAVQTWESKEHSRDFLWMGERNIEMLDMIERLKPTLNEAETAFSRMGNIINTDIKLSELSRSEAAQLTLDNMLKTIVGDVRGIVHTLNIATSTLERVCTAGFDNDNPKHQKFIKRINLLGLNQKNGISEAALHRGRNYVEDVQAGEEMFFYSDMPDMRSVLSMAIYGSREPIDGDNENPQVIRGVITVISSAPDAFRLYDLAYFANQIELAWLYGIQKRRMDELATINQEWGQVSSYNTRDRWRMLNIWDKIERLIGATSGLIVERHIGTGELHWADDNNVLVNDYDMIDLLNDEDNEEQQEEYWDNGVHGWVVKSRKAINVPDVNEIPHFDPDDESQDTGEQIYFLPMKLRVPEPETGATVLMRRIRSQLAVPMLDLKGMIRGVISVESPVPYAFDANDMRFLQVLANQAWSVIDNAQSQRNDTEVGILPTFFTMLHDHKNTLTALMVLLDVNADVIEAEEETLNRVRRYIRLLEETEISFRQLQQQDVVQSQIRLVSDILEDILKSFNDQQSKDSQPIQIEMKNCEEIYIPFDTRLEHVFRNLLQNAIKYGKAPIVIGAEPNPVTHMVALWVEDNGLGIPQKTLETIYEPKFTRNEESGWGLGLWFTKLFVQSMGGMIEKPEPIDDKTEHGTRLRFWLPY